MSSLEFASDFMVRNSAGSTTTGNSALQNSVWFSFATHLKCVAKLQRTVERCSAKRSSVPPPLAARGRPYRR
jgi:hypothetical protein